MPNFLGIRRSVRRVYSPIYRKLNADGLI